MTILVGKRCGLCNRNFAEYRGYCLNCAELIDQIIQAKKRMNRWLNVKKPCGCITCINQEKRDRENLDELIAIGVEVKNNGW